MPSPSTIDSHTVTSSYICWDYLTYHPTLPSNGNPFPLTGHGSAEEKEIPHMPEHLVDFLFSLFLINQSYIFSKPIQTQDNPSALFRNYIHFHSGFHYFYFKWNYCHPLILILYLLSAVTFQPDLFSFLPLNFNSLKASKSITDTSALISVKLS